MIKKLLGKVGVHYGSNKYAFGSNAEFWILFKNRMITFNGSVLGFISEGLTSDMKKGSIKEGGYESKQIYISVRYQKIMSPEIIRKKKQEEMEAVRLKEIERKNKTSVNNEYNGITIRPIKVPVERPAKNYVQVDEIKLDLKELN